MKKILLTLIIASINVIASDLTTPNTFVANTPALATKVNQNFNAVETAVDDNNTRLAALETLVAQLQTSLNTANNTISSLQSSLATTNTNVTGLDSRLTMVEGNSVLELDGLLNFNMFRGYPTAEFTGVNVQINNGINSTSNLNGLGNLIVGYNESQISAPFFCSDPQYTDSVNCIGNLETWDQNVITGSHNIILGIGNSYTKFSSFIGG